MVECLEYQAVPGSSRLLVKHSDGYSDGRACFELFAIDKIVAASSPGGKWLPNSGKVKDGIRENT